MAAKEKYDRIIECIENEVEEGSNTAPGLIASSVMEQCNVGLGGRDLSAVFTFLTDKSLNQYIRDRQFNRAYSELVEKNSSIDLAMSYTAVSDQSNFTNAFRERFGMTPKEAQMRREKSLISPPLTWNIMSEIPIMPKLEERNMSEKTLFGIAPDMLKKINEAQDYQVLFDFNDELSNAAFELAIARNITMKEAFSFTEEYSLYWEAVFGEELIRCQPDWFSDLKDNDSLLNLYFNYHMSVSEAMEIIGGLQRQGVEDVSKIDSDILDAYLQCDINYNRLKELHDYFFDRDDTDPYDWLEFVGLVESGETPEDAVEQTESFFLASVEKYSNLSSDELVADLEDEFINIYEKDDYEYYNYPKEDR